MLKPLLCIGLLAALPHASAEEDQDNLSVGEYAFEPLSAPYAERREALLRHYAENPGHSLYRALACLALNQAPPEEALLGAVGNIQERHDCADFRMNGLLRLLYQFGGSPLISPGVLDRIHEAVLGFKYWPDEPGIDSMCTWSENHHIMFATAGYLAGQRFPDETFTNAGHTGRDKMAAHRPRILRWLDLRFRTGFSEWLSNTYYDEDMAPLLNLADFCEDEEIRLRATMILDLLLADMALNSFRGHFASTHGRAYENQKKCAARENVADVQWLLFGQGIASGSGSMSGSYFALSPRYRMPRVIETMARDVDRPEMLNRQRMGIRIDEAGRWGIGFDNFEDGMTLLSLEAYAHPRTINLFVDMLGAFNWWENDFFKDFAAARPVLSIGRKMGLLPQLARLFEWDMTRNTREEVNIYTYRTPDYILSSAPDYRKAYGGDQQSVWQAALGPEAVCFTTHPPRSEGRSPNYWTGSGQLPRVGQHKNVAIAIYRLSDRRALYVRNQLFLTHAWLPQDRFDQVVERDGWIFAQYRDAYLALHSQNPYHWQTAEGEDQNREIIVPGKQNIWICELGRREDNGPFEAFVDAIASAPLTHDGLSTRYESPSQGLIEFGWDGPLICEGSPIPMNGYPRYDNPYTQTPFPAEHITFTHNGHTLDLDWNTPSRQASACLDPSRP